jgi:predicted PhzF superfamily epimerase YddE/YHI9
MSNNRTIYQVDAFTDEPFRGNPAGVMIVDETVSRTWMQDMAMEMNLSETAFLIKNGPDYRIRYFTPSTEVPLCGHATLASSHIVFELGLRKPGETIVFKAAGGDLYVRKDTDWLVMNFPVYPIRKIEISPLFRKLVGFEPLEMYSSNDAWVIAVAGSEQEIQDASPDFGSLTANGLGHLMITSRCDSGRADFTVRCFAPLSGINEDPVTGSAHCALTPLWGEKLGKTEMDSLQLSKRTGRLKVSQADGRVLIKGKALTVFEAQLKI